MLVAGCSGPEPPAGSATPSLGRGTDSPSRMVSAAPRASSPPTSRPPTYAAAGVLARLAALTPERLAVTALPAASPVVVDACPGAAFVSRPPGSAALVRQWGDVAGPTGTEIYLAAIVYPDPEAAARALGPVQRAVPACQAPPAQRGLTVAVSDAGAAPLAGAPGASLGISYATPQGTTYDRVTVVQLGNVALRVTATARDPRRAAELSTRTLAQAVAAVRRGPAG